MRRRVKSVVPLADRMIGNLRNWLLGTHDGVSRGQLQVYLDEFVKLPCSSVTPAATRRLNSSRKRSTAPFITRSTWAPGPRLKPRHAKLPVFERGEVIRAYKDAHPKLSARAWVDPSAQVIGDVELGEDASVWMNAVVRGDVNRIRIGARTNVQDSCVLHVTAQHPTVLAEEVTVGHSVNLHGCTIERLCLIGIGASVLDGAVVGEESIVAAGALVPEGMRVPARSLVMGAPAKVRRELSEEERSGLRRYAESYVGYKEDYRRAGDGR